MNGILMTESELDRLAEDLLDIVEKFEGLGASEAQLIKAQFIETLRKALKKTP